MHVSSLLETEVSATRYQTKKHKEDEGFSPRAGTTVPLKNPMKQMENTSKLQLCPAIKCYLRMAHGMFIRPKGTGFSPFFWSERRHHQRGRNKTPECRMENPEYFIGIVETPKWLGSIIPQSTANNHSFCSAVKCHLFETWCFWTVKWMLRVGLGSKNPLQDPSSQCAQNYSKLIERNSSMEANNYTENVDRYAMLWIYPSPSNIGKWSL